MTESDLQLRAERAFEDMIGNPACSTFEQFIAALREKVASGTTTSLGLLPQDVVESGRCLVTYAKSDPISVGCIVIHELRKALRVADSSDTGYINYWIKEITRSINESSAA